MIGALAKYQAKLIGAISGDGIYAYRGQQDYDWPLHSAATRRLIKEHGQEALDDPDFTQSYIGYHRDVFLDPARTRGFGHERGRRLTDIELLAKLQHFGAATGLLDFTWNPLVALWFVCEDYSIDGKLYAINTNDPLRVSRVPTDESRQNVADIFTNQSNLPTLYYWEPTATGEASARILGQRSVFIIGRPLFPEDDQFIREILIAREDKEQLCCCSTIRSPANCSAKMMLL